MGFWEWIEKKHEISNADRKEEKLYFWEWLAKKHPVIDMIVWAGILVMNIAAIFISLSK